MEKSVAPKGLLTIPLPKPLEDFTWLYLGQTIMNLHKYLTNNNMVMLLNIIYQQYLLIWVRSLFRVTLRKSI